jgi:threonine dehydratase
VGVHNWPILRKLVRQSLAIPDLKTRQAMRWLYEHHGLKTEPSGAIAVAGLLSGEVDLSGDGDVVVVLSGRNADEEAFRAWIATE